MELAEKLAADLSVLVNRKRKEAANQAQLLSIEEIEAKLATKQQEKEAVKQELVELEKQLKQDYKQCDRATAKFSKEGGKIAAERDKFETKIEELNEQLAVTRQELIRLVDSRLSLSLIVPLLNNAIAQGEKEYKAQQFQQAQGIIEERDSKLLDYIKDIALTKEAISKIEFFIETENQLIADSINDSADCYLDLREQQLQQLKTTINDRLPFEVDLSRNLKQEIEKLKSQIDTTEAQLASAASPEDYQKLIDAVEKAKAAVSKSKAKYDIATDKLAKIEREIERIEQELNRTLKNYSEEAIDKIGDEHIINSATKVQSTLKLFKDKLTFKKHKLEGLI